MSYIRLQGSVRRTVSADVSSGFGISKKSTLTNLDITSSVTIYMT